MHNNPPPPNFYNKNNIAMVYQKVHHLIHILKYQIPQNNLLYHCMNMLSMNYQMIQLDRITLIDKVVISILAKKILGRMLR